MLKSILLLCPLSFLGCLPAARAADPGAQKPYQLQVVLHVARHRLLTDVFRDRVERELRDGLQASLGELARVEVVRDHPRLQYVLDQGLQRALDGWKERSEVKTHFVLIDFSGTYYEIQARQHDGLTGQASPVVRRDRTRDRDFVARAASLLVDRDFGMVGTVVGAAPGPADQETFKVELHGGAPGVPLERWVKKDDVFAVVPVPPGSGAVQALSFALLQVVETSRDGACVCRFYHRIKNVGNIVGYRCLKLATTQDPVRVRLRLAQLKDGKTVPLQETLMVQVRRHGFDKDAAVELPTDSEGLVDTAKRNVLFDKAAFITILKDRKPFVQVPLALVEDRLENLVVSITTDPGALLAEHLDAWTQKVRESYLVQVNFFREINRLGAKLEENKEGDKDLSARAEIRAQSLKRAEAGLERSKKDYAGLAAERTDLLNEARQTPGAKQPDLATGNNLLQQIKEGEEKLSEHIVRMRKIEEEENDPKRKEWLARVEQGTLLEEELEFEKAIALYKQVLKDGLQNDKLQKHLADLEKRWNTDDPKLKEARKFIYDVWPGLDTPGLKNRIGDAEKALNDCIAAGDFIGPQKMLKVAAAHATRMDKELKELKDYNIDDEMPIRVIKELSPQLRSLINAIDAHLKKAQPEK
jgi:hypothetical protein